MKTLGALLWLLIAIAVIMVILNEAKGMTVFNVGMSIPTESSRKLGFEGDIKWLSPRAGYWYYGMHVYGNTATDVWVAGFGPMHFRRGLDYAALMIYLGEGESNAELANYEAGVGVVDDLTLGSFQITSNIRYLWCLTEQNEVIEQKAVVNPLRICWELGELSLGGSLVASVFMNSSDREIKTGPFMGWRDFRLIYYIGSIQEIQLGANFKF